MNTTTTTYAIWTKGPSRHYGEGPGWALARDGYATRAEAEEAARQDYPGGGWRVCEAR